MCNESLLMVEFKLPFSMLVVDFSNVVQLLFLVLLHYSNIRGMTLKLMTIFSCVEAVDAIAT